VDFVNSFALIRHGDISGPNLSPGGERQASSLGRQLRDLGRQRVRVISSPAPRARQTASPMCALLDLLEPEEDMRLWSGPDGDPDSWEKDLPGLVDQLDVWGAEVELLVVVTHFEICCGLPPLLRRMWTLAGQAPQGLARGHGWWVKRVAGTTGRLLRP
jgi:hypothetical protein